MLGAVTISRASLEPIIDEMSAKYNVPTALIKATISTESNWDTNASRYEAALGDSSWGLMQILLKTAQSILDAPGLTISDLQNPRVNIEAGTKYLASQLRRYNENIPDAIAAYNAGRARYNSVRKRYMNQSYVNKVYGYYVMYKGLEAVGGATAIPLIALGVGIVIAIPYFIKSKSKPVSTVTVSKN